MLGRQDLCRRTACATNQHGPSRTGLAAALGPGPPHCERPAEHVGAPQQDPQVTQQRALYALPTPVVSWYAPTRRFPRQRSFVVGSLRPGSRWLATEEPVA